MSKPSGFVVGAKFAAERQRRGTTYTTSEFADELGVSVSTVKRWRKLDRLRPSRSVTQGKIDVHLYTKDDLRKARRLVQP